MIQIVILSLTISSFLEHFLEKKDKKKKNKTRLIERFWNVVSGKFLEKKPVLRECQNYEFMFSETVSEKYMATQIM